MRVDEAFVFVFTSFRIVWDVVRCWQTVDLRAAMKHDAWDLENRAGSVLSLTRCRVHPQGFRPYMGLKEYTPGNLNFM
jgi:hypothetical protein